MPDAMPSCSATTPSNDGPAPRRSARPKSVSVPAWIGTPVPRSAATGSAGADTRNAPPVSAATARAPPIEPSAAMMRTALFSTASVPLTRSIATPRTRAAVKSAPVVCTTMRPPAMVARTGPRT